MGKISDALDKSGQTPKVTPLKVKDTREATDIPAQQDKPLHPVPAKDARPSVTDSSPKQDKPAILPDKGIRQGNVDKNLVVLSRPQSFESEQFKLLRTNILFPGSGKPPRSIMITSAVPGEGKTFVASNLAVSIAQNINEHVLLIDCDMRRPMIHAYFGFTAKLGLTDYLADDRPLNSLFFRPNINKLTILPAGKPPHNPSELLSSTRMSELLQEVKGRYSDRYIIIDSPPPQITPETAAIARQVDGIILVVRCGSTPRELVENVVDNLGKDKVLGVVFNRVDLSGSKYYGYGKYSKYYKQYH